MKKRLLFAIFVLLIVLACLMPFEFSTTEPTPQNLLLSIDQMLTATATAVPTILPTPTVWAQKPTALPIPDDPSGRIIYTCQVDKNPSHDQICMINADGSGFRQLTDDLETAHFYPSWAADGNSFYYAGVHQYQFKIFHSDLMGNAELVGRIPGELFAPMPSPDGNSIIFTRHVNETAQHISIYDLETETFRDLTGYYDARDPVWSPDGSKIMFSSSQHNTPQLYFMNANGTLIQQITELAGLRGRSDWAKDLTVATYGGDFENHNREIILLSLNGEPHIITDGGDNLAPSFSPDGQWIVFMSYRDHFWQADGCELYVMRCDGTDVRRLTDNDYCDYQPRWEK
jgi:Tol biopolymer transport system component